MGPIAKLNGLSGHWAYMKLGPMVQIHSLYMHLSMTIWHLKKNHI